MTDTTPQQKIQKLTEANEAMKRICERAHRLNDEWEETAQAMADAHDRVISRTVKLVMTMGGIILLEAGIIVMLLLRP